MSLVKTIRCSRGEADTAHTGEYVALAQKFGGIVQSDEFERGREQGRAEHKYKCVRCGKATTLLGDYGWVCDEHSPNKTIERLERDLQEANSLYRIKEESLERELAEAKKRAAETYDRYEQELARVTSERERLLEFNSEALQIRMENTRLRAELTKRQGEPDLSDDEHCRHGVYGGCKPCHAAMSEPAKCALCASETTRNIPHDCQKPASAGEAREEWVLYPNGHGDWKVVMDSAASAAMSHTVRVIRKSLYDALKAENAELRNVLRKTTDALDKTTDPRISAQICRDLEVMEKERDELRAENAELKSAVEFQANYAEKWRKERDAALAEATSAKARIQDCSRDYMAAREMAERLQKENEELKSELAKRN